MRGWWIFAIVTTAFAQAPRSPTFEVATIKPSAPAGMGPVRFGTRGGPGTPDPGRFMCERCSILDLMSTAYDIDRGQISGPDFIRSAQFDVVAKVPDGSTKEQLREMVKNLLIERFKLAAHFEKKEMPIYELVVAKGGPKLKDSAGPPDMPRAEGPPLPPPRPARPDGTMQLPPGRTSLMMIGPRGGHWRLVDESMGDFAKHLQAMVGRPVTDGTALKGKYDFELTFTPDFAAMGRGRGLLMPPPPPSAPATGGDGPAPDDSAPTIFTAIQDQLGLKLESKKGPVDLVVVDHVEKSPTEN